MTAQLPSPPNRGLGYIKIRYHNLPKNREIASLGECSSYEYIWQGNGSVLLADLLPDVIFDALCWRRSPICKIQRGFRENHTPKKICSIEVETYSVLALFFATGIKCENHSAAIILLDEIFGIDNSAIKSAKSERIDKQYYVATAPVHSEVITLIKTAELFNAKLLDVVDRLTKDKIDSFRKKLLKLIG